MLEVADSLIEVDRLNLLAGIVILAGGASKRMGSPKAELILPTGERLLDYHVRQALELSAALINNVPIMIADNKRGFTITPDFLKKNPQSSVFPITDYLSANGFSNKILSSNDDKPIKTGGALVAIEAALQALASSNQLTKDASWQQSWLLVISCDSLISISDLWQKLQPHITQAADKSVICLTDNSHLYPLLGLYHLSIEPDLKHYIDNGQRQVMRFIKPIVKPVALPQNWQYLTNFNTPDAFDCACTALRDI
ncbi:NTP transferase domain-containing protein [Psychrobacter sp. W2-37-MNA-CIBAN-0211]|uniref:molybdenum cofactor guanylyltransferase n=1 Tax=Psychrobacter sp. W2-37-MNA-CIBAN-0211 TaxID=3140443 RepID=UPI00331C4020